MTRRKVNSRRKAVKPSLDDEEKEPLEQMVADKIMYGPDSEGYFGAFAEEEAELVPSDMIESQKYKQVITMCWCFLPCETDSLASLSLSLSLFYF